MAPSSCRETPSEAIPPASAQLDVWRPQRSPIRTAWAALADVAVYDRAITAKEIADHYQAGKLPAEAPAVEPVADGPQPEFPPLSPQESLKVTHVRDGFEMELMAAEPMVVDPVAIEWGPDGKLWVAEMADYPLGMDGKMKPGGRIRYLEDTDGDGKYDKSTLFMTGVNFPTGVLPWRSGVIVTAAPEIFFYAADTNGDGKADCRRNAVSRGLSRGTHNCGSTACSGGSMAGCIAPTAGAAARCVARRAASRWASADATFAFTWRITWPTRSRASASLAAIAMIVAVTGLAATTPTRCFTYCVGRPISTLQSARCRRRHQSAGNRSGVAKSVRP